MVNEHDLKCEVLDYISGKEQSPLFFSLMDAEASQVHTLKIMWFKNISHLKTQDGLFLFIYFRLNLLQQFGCLGLYPHSTPAKVSVFSPYSPLNQICPIHLPWPQSQPALSERKSSHILNWYVHIWRTVCRKMLPTVHVDVPCIRDALKHLTCACYY